MKTGKNDIGPENIFTVVDTSAFITYPGLISQVRGQVFVPLTVIKQLDGLKNNSDSDLSKRARQASFFIERAIEERKVAILTQFDRVDGLDNESDNRIVGAALRLKNSRLDAKVTVLSTDRNMRIAARGYGLFTADIQKRSRTRLWELALNVWFSAFAAIVITITGFFMVLAPNITFRIILLVAGAALLIFFYFMFSALKENHNVDLSPLAYIPRGYDGDSDRRNCEYASGLTTWRRMSDNMINNRNWGG